MLRTDLAFALDPVLLAERVGIEPDPWQADVLRSRAKQKILLASRQSGKSTVTSLLAVDKALHRPPALVLLLAPALRQSQEIFRKVKDVLHALGDVVPPLVRETELTLELANGSRIVSLPGKEATVRSYSNAALLVVDEAARVSDALYYSVRPMLAVSGGELVLLSTPFGKRGFFFHEYTEGGPDWHRVRIPATACPRIPAAWLAQEKQRIPLFWYRQEYSVEFLDAVDSVFEYELIEAAFTPDVEPLFPVAA